MIQNNGPHYVLCSHCDLLTSLPVNKPKHKIVCPRCNSLLERSHSDMQRDTIICSICALLMLLFTLYFVFINLRITGITNNVTLLNIPNYLLQDKFPSLMVLFVVCVLALPMLSLVIKIILCLPQFTSIIGKRRLLVIYRKLHQWAMPEIFLVGIIVSFVKLDNYGQIGINQAFITFCLFLFLYLKAMTEFSVRTIWLDVANNNFVTRPLKVGETGISQNVRLCLCCHAILPGDLRVCPRCQQKGQLRERDKVQWTMALVLTSSILYIPANIYAVMITIFLGSTSPSTIIDGVIFMWQDGDYPVALVIFSASILIPVLKILTLAWLCYFTLRLQNASAFYCLRIGNIFKIIEFIGRWSMIDIFVVIVISSLLRNGEIISVYPDIGAIFFAGVVIITMLASQKYDPRLIWDKAPLIKG